MRLHYTSMTMRLLLLAFLLVDNKKRALGVSLLYQRIDEITATLILKVLFDSVYQKALSSLSCAKKDAQIYK